MENFFNHRMLYGIQVPESQEKEEEMWINKIEVEENPKISPRLTFEEIQKSKELLREALKSTDFRKGYISRLAMKLFFIIENVYMPDIQDKVKWSIEKAENLLDEIFN